MAKRRIWKRLLLLLGIVVLGLVVLVLTSPYWVPPLIKQTAEGFGITYQSLERLDDGRFALKNLVRTNEKFDLEISSIEGFRPIEWIERVRRGETNPPPRFLVVNGWRVVVHPENFGKDGERDPGEPGVERSVYDYYQLAREYLPEIRKWLPNALLQNGIIEFQDRHVTFATITWEDGELDAAGTWPENAIPISIKARLTEDRPYQLFFAMHPLDFSTRLRIQGTNQMVRTELRTIYKQTRVDLKAFFPTNGLIPAHASLQSRNFNLPPDLLHLEQQYQNVTGNLSGIWTNQTYSLNLEAHAEPLHSATNLPPVDVTLALQGNTNSVRIEELQAIAPGLRVQASAPIELDYEGRLLSPRSQLDIAADLAQLPWLDLEGTIDAQLILEPGDQLPLLNFRAAGENLRFQQIGAASLELAGRLDWPLLEDVQGQVRFGTNGVVTFAAAADLQARVIQEASLRVEGAIAREALPEGIHYDSIQFQAQAEGPITNLQHQARLQLRGFEAPSLRPLNLDLEWQARQADFDRLALLARAGPAELFVSGTGRVDPASTNLVIRELRLGKGAENYLSLAEPFAIGLLSTNLAEAGPVPLLRLAPLHWQGEGRALHLAGSLAWPYTGTLSAAATNVHPDLFQPFFTQSLSGLHLAELALDASWNQGPLKASVTGNFSAAHDPFDWLSARLQAEINGDGLTLSDLAVNGTNGAIVTAQGFLPLSVHPLAPVRPIRLSSRENLDFQLRTAPNKPFWNTVADLAGLRLEEPFVSLEVSGTTRKPAGTLSFQVATVELLQTNQPLPVVRHLAGSVQLSEAALTIPGIELEIEGEPLRLTAQAPLGEPFWDLQPEQIQAWLLTNTTARLRAPDFQVAPFARFFPEYVAPQGRVRIDAGLEPGLNLSGAILATNISTRPLPKIGVVENIAAHLELDARQVRVENVSAMLGGEKIQVTGLLDVGPDELARGFPGISLSIQGENVPLARNPDIILRTDLDLLISNAAANPPVVSGTVRLRDSVLLQDIATLVPGRVASPSRRPPYFSIEQDPLDEWLLDVRVRGVDFMRVRSPFFIGRVSANFHVTGTLEEPMALGEAAITSGRIIFPFATLGVTQAIVSLTSAQPYLPHVFAVAKGRAFGYDITMQVEGPADEPVIEFSSVPPLTSEEIVLLLTTGQIPRSDFGFSSEERASRLALFLGKSLWQKLNPGEGGEERLTIRSGEDVSEEGKQTYSVEYKLTDDWSLVGEYDRFGAVNAGVQWKIFSR